MTIKTLLIATLTLSACGAADSAGPAATPAAVTPTAPASDATGPALIARATELVWRPCAMDGCEIAVLEGNPDAEGPFTVRMRSTKPMLVPPHRHPATARVTVLRGTLHVGFQDTVDKAAAMVFEAGDYYVNEGAPHFVWTDEPTELQLSGNGPWKFLPVGDHAH